MKKNLLAISILLFFAAAAAAAQQPVPTPQPTPIREINNAPNLPRNTMEINDRDKLEESRWERTFIPRAPFDISKAARDKVKVSKEEKARYEKISSDNDLKILKVFSAPQCAEKPLVLNAGDERCAAAADLLRVSFYSFLIGYYGETISDFRLLEDTLIAGNGRNIHGFLVDLGKTEIGKIAKDSAEVAALRNYPTATTIKEEGSRRSELEKGFKYQNLEISSKQKLQADHVYLMRLVSYSSKDDWANIYNKDSVYVFQVGGLTDDGMAVILWRRLSQKNAPRLKNEE